MFTLNSEMQFYLYSGSTDMRKSFDSLSGIIQNKFSMLPTTGDVYVFINKRRNKMKLLHWAGGGFVLYYKRLESGTFERLNYNKGNSVLQLSYSQIVMLVDGISIKNIEQKKRYK